MESMLKLYVIRDLVNNNNNSTANCILKHTTLGRTPLDERSARRRHFYLTTHNTHNEQTSVTPVGFEPAVLPSERSHTHALDRAAAGICLDVRLYYMSGRNQQCVGRFYIDISVNTAAPKGCDLNLLIQK